MADKYHVTEPIVRAGNELVDFAFSRDCSATTY